MRHPIGTMGLLVAGLTALAFASPARAVDGVIELSQANAAAAGILFNLATPGSYRLTTNLATTDPDRTIISIGLSGDYAIDLNGFTISGPAQCSGAPATCTSGTGSGTGVRMLFQDATLTLSHGTIRGMGGRGIWSFGPTRIEAVHVIGNGSDGIIAGPDSIIRDSAARSNGGSGITVGANTTVQDSASLGNATNGITGAFDQVSVVRSTVVDNGGNGIVLNGPATVRDCRIDNHTFAGLSVGEDSVVTGNSVSDSTTSGISVGPNSVVRGNSVTGSGGNGILISAGTGASVVIGNTAANNGAGLNCVSSCAYAQNVFQGNATNVSVGAVEIGTNFCGTNTTCP